MNDNLRERLLDHKQRKEASSRQLDACLVLLNETERVGAETLVQLGIQRDSITRSRKTMDRIDENLGAADSILTRMSKSWINPTYWFGK